MLKLVVLSGHRENDKEAVTNYILKNGIDEKTRLVYDEHSLVTTEQILEICELGFTFEVVYNPISRGKMMAFIPTSKMVNSLMSE